MAPTNPPTALDFHDRFSTEEACEEFLFKWRWPEGFRCPRCDGDEATKLATRRQYQCRACRYQVSVTAGTALHRTRLKLRVWFYAIFLVARHKKSVSALQLQGDLGIGSDRTAWLLLHKIRACFDESSDYPLRGLVEVDETYVGGKEKGALHGRAAGRKRIVVAGVEVRPDGHLGDARMQVIPDVKAQSLIPFVRKYVDPSASVATDGWPAFSQLSRHFAEHQRHVSVGPRDGTFKPVLNGAHLLISNLKTWLTGRFHGVSRKYLPAYVAEYMYRYNRRRSPPDIFGWVMRRLMARDTMTLRALRACADPGA